MKRYLNVLSVLSLFGFVALATFVILKTKAPKETSADIVHTVQKARALDSHCLFMRVQMDSLRRDIHNNDSEGIKHIFEPMSANQYESLTVCVQKDDGDPAYLPKHCDTYDKTCILEQLDHIQAVMK